MIINVTESIVQSETEESKGVIFLGRSDLQSRVVECIIKTTLALVNSSAFPKNNKGWLLNLEIANSLV